MIINTCKKLLVLPLIFASTSVLANTYSFAPTNANQNNQGLTIGSLFELEVLSAGADQVTFSFSNLNTLSSAIIGVYIGGPTLFSASSFVESDGVNFSAINQSQPQTGFDIEAASRSVNQGGQNFINGINSGTAELLTYTLTLASGNTFDTVIDSLNSGSLLVGVTGQNDGQGNDQYLINTPSAVPLPAALPLMASALGLFGLGAKRRKAVKAANA
ncbi:MAG TPA: VPLPA-CTERM sorting domain-containing protein [Methylophilus sp.]